ncbi:MAG: 2-dehydropantoate 2-reductase N-terminal domain-containing protein [Gemmatimonadales bacterium]|nr:2-dehydropantoate 2-reductase N-terminal domain-containing protein [Gemmatimonadales bacterium]
MRLLIIGLGAVGCAYGHALREAGHDVVHLPRRRPAGARAAVRFRLLDGRRAPAEGRSVSYQPEVVATPKDAGPVDLALLAVRTADFRLAADRVRALPGQPLALVLGEWWSDRAMLDEHLGERGWLLGRPEAGGRLGTEESLLALRPTLTLGEQPAIGPATRARVTELFASGGIATRWQPEAIHALWLHHAITGAIGGAAHRVGGFDALLADTGHRRECAVCIREALAVCAARSVPLERFEEGHLAFAPAPLLADHLAALWTADPVTRAITRLRALDADARACFDDVWLAARRLGLQTPALDRCRPHVAAPPGAAA